MKRTTDPIHLPPTTGVILATLLLGLLVLPTGALGAPGDARISGSLKDQEGQPVGGVKVVLVPDDAKLPTLEAETNKKGRFVWPAVRHGSYRPQIQSDAFTLEQVFASVRGSDGSMLEGFEAANVAVNGSPLMEIPPAARITMKLSVAPRSAAAPQAGAGALHGVAGATGDLERLNALFDLAKWAELVTESEAYLVEKPDDGGAVYLNAVALWQSGSLERAAAQFERAAELIPEQTSLHGTIASCLLEYGNALEAEGRTEEAAARYSAAADELAMQLEETPEAMTHLINYVIACEKSDRTDEAIATLRRIVQLEPGRVDVRVRLGELLTDAGKVDEAIEVFLATPGGDPAQIADRIYNAAIVLYNDGKADETAAAMQAAIPLAPGNALLHRLLARALLQTGDDEQALTELRKAVELDPDDPAAETDRQLIAALEKKLAG